MALESSMSKTYSVRIPSKEFIPRKRIQPTKWSQNLARYIVTHPVFSCITWILTGYALAGDDIRLIFTDKPADYFFNGLIVAAFLVFGLELLMSTVSQKDYPFSFFFWLDFLSLLTLIMDLTYVSDAMYSYDQASDFGSYDVRSGRYARIAFKASRLVRVMRLFRAIKVLKARMHAKRHIQAKEDDFFDDADLQDELEEYEPADESRVGKRLSELTTRRVIFLILSIFLVPQVWQDSPPKFVWSGDYGAIAVAEALDGVMAGVYNAYSTYERELLRLVLWHNWYANELRISNGDRTDYAATSYYSSLFWFGVTGYDVALLKKVSTLARLQQPRAAKLLDQAAAAKSIMDSEPSAFSYGHYPRELSEFVSTPWSECPGANILRVGVSIVPGRVDCPEQLRAIEVTSFRSASMGNETTGAWFFTVYGDKRIFTKESSKSNIYSMLVVVALLLVSATAFAHDTNVILLRPIEQMVMRVAEIRKNPLIAMDMAYNDYYAAEKQRRNEEKMLKKMRNNYVWRLCYFLKSVGVRVLGLHNQSVMLETKILEKTIIKLGSLLAIGLGAAGEGIIGASLAGGGLSQPNVYGTRVNVIIGVARIVNFKLATEVLRSNIVTYVNEIAEIVHGVVALHHGFVNKNPGEEFVIIWKDKASAGKEQISRRLAELSVISFVKINISIHRSRTLATYREHPGLQHRLKALQASTRVQLSFGLHLGWAIEGAVGSEFKIDASYVSSHVNIAMALEQYTQVMGVTVCVSQSVVELCSSALTLYLREIDNAILPGVQMASIRIYSLDMAPHLVTVDTDVTRFMWMQTKSMAQLGAASKKHLHEQQVHLLASNKSPCEFLAKNRYFNQMRSTYGMHFLMSFSKGYQNYQLGDWAVAKTTFEQTSRMMGTPDGPSCCLLEEMALYNFTAPKLWKGVRDLNAKSSYRTRAKWRKGFLAKNMADKFLKLSAHDAQELPKIGVTSSCTSDEVMRASRRETPPAQIQQLRLQFSELDRRTTKQTVSSAAASVETVYSERILKSKELRRPSKKKNSKERMTKAKQKPSD